MGFLGLAELYMCIAILFGLLWLITFSKVNLFTRPGLMSRMWSIFWRLGAGLGVVGGFIYLVAGIASGEDDYIGGSIASLIFDGAIATYAIVKHRNEKRDAVRQAEASRLAAIQAKEQAKIDAVKANYDRDFGPIKADIKQQAAKKPGDRD